MRWFYPVLWTVLVIVCSFFISKMNTESYARIQNIEYFLDFDGQQTIDSITQQSFVPSDKKTIPPKALAIWLKLQIPEVVSTWQEGAILFTGSNEAAVSMQGYIFQNGHTEDMGFCDVQLNSLKCSIPTLEYSFPLPQSEMKNLTYYLKIIPGAAGINNEFYFMKKTYYNKITIFLTHFLGLSSGVYLIAAIIALIFFSSLRESSFLIYALFHFNLFASLTINRGIWDAFGPTINALTGANLLFPVLILTVFFDLLFIKVFFEISKKHPLLNKIYLAFLTSILVLISLSFFPQTQVMVWRSLSPAIFSSMILVGLTLIYFIWQRRLWAEQVTTAWCVAIVCNLIWTGYRAGLIEGFWFYGYYSIVGRTLEALLLNIVIFQKLQRLTLKVGFAQAQNQESKVTKTLLRSLSHDLSNTTQILKSNAQILKENIEGLSNHKNIDRILEAAEQQADIIKNAKTSFLVRGQPILNLSSVNLKLAINEVLEMYRSKVEEKNLTIVMQIANEEINIVAEKTSLHHQVLSNLINNACKFTHSGKKIYIAVNLVDSSTVELKIKDEGVGISNEVLDRLFDDEIEISHAGTQGETGTGHGLLIVRDFVNMYGGSILLDSKIDQGVEVTLRFKRSH